MIIEYYLSKILKKARLRAIKNSYIHPTSKVEAGSELINVKMGKYSFCGYDCEIANCEIGSFTSIANKVVIGGGMHPMDWVGMSPVFYEGRDSVKAKYSEHKRQLPLTTSIGNDVWIGHGVHLKAGVNIGHGAVIGMGSVVTKDVKPYDVVAGVPARLIRKRFDDSVIAKLLTINWWDLRHEELKECAKYFNSPEKLFEILNI